MSLKSIKSALISVYHKDGLDTVVKSLNDLGVTIYSTGGTEKFIKSLGVPVVSVESITDFPEVFGGRVKTLHPKIFGGILHRRDFDADTKEKETHKIPAIDLVVVDLYPFENTVASGANEVDVIEKIDIGGISLIRAAAKNFKDVVCVASKNQYADLQEILNSGAQTHLQQRKKLATESFAVSSHYDTQIFKYFNGEEISHFRESYSEKKPLRYGENPHQKGFFYGDLEAVFDKLNGKELSFNNLLDVDAAVKLMQEFHNDKPTFAILKHNNACGLAQDDLLKNAFDKALSADPVSAFGGILIANTKIDLDTAKSIHQVFCEVVIAPEFSEQAIDLLTQKKNRILLRQKQFLFTKEVYRTALNGVLAQQADDKTDSVADLKNVTKITPAENQIADLLFASKIGKHTKSNTIVLAKNKQLYALGTGQTSRVDALKQAIEKALAFGFDLSGAVMASDAFFPFPDCVEIAKDAGITAVIQPGGSIKDQLSIDYCDAHKIAMVFTGIRHFKH